MSRPLEIFADMVPVHSGVRRFVSQGCELLVEMLGPMLDPAVQSTSPITDPLVEYAIGELRAVLTVYPLDPNDIDLSARITPEDQQRLQDLADFMRLDMLAAVQFLESPKP